MEIFILDIRVQIKRFEKLTFYIYDNLLTSLFEKYTECKRCGE